MGFKDLPGGQNDKNRQGRADLAKELTPKTKDTPKNQ
jgi:hypothetical protein